ncbi:MAG TPA: TlpA disulfide reductase family protein [Bryobacteraceae bacterium]|nr:TlpA disulfide reductase family protein [Bryobacteraceae bacterium]
MLALLLAPLAAAALTIGQPAPPLSVRQLLQAPPAAVANWPALRGKAVVLGFWATWCTPCVAQIPRWNAMVERHKGRPVQFIAITSEDPDLIAGFLETHPMAGWIALDAEERTLSAYGIESVPFTVLVDAKGVVQAVTSLDHLTDADVNTLIAGRELRPLPQPSPG